MIEEAGFTLVIDSGPDFRQQMLREQVKKLDAIVFTHSHKDHVAGLDDIRAFNFFSGEPIDIYATIQVQEAIKREFSYAFDLLNDYPWIPKMKLHTITADPFEIGPLKINPVQVLHYKLPVLGFRFARRSPGEGGQDRRSPGEGGQDRRSPGEGGQDRRSPGEGEHADFTYITDASFISEEEQQKIKGTKILVLNALRKEKHISHFNLDEAIAMAERIGAEKTFFTHISHQMGLHDVVSAQLPKNIFLAYDGLKVEV